MRQGNHLLPRGRTGGVQDQGNVFFGSPLDLPIRGGGHTNQPEGPRRTGRLHFDLEDPDAKLLGNPRAGVA